MRKLLLFTGVFLVVFACIVPTAQQPPKTIDQLVEDIKTAADAIKALNAPPRPVNCTTAVDLTFQSAGVWSSCVGGQQTRMEVWAQTVLTPAANGGTCQPLTQNRKASQACGVTPPPTGTPTITGVSWSGGTATALTVTGANFGTKAAQRPWKWDDMNGTNGARLEPRGWLVHVNTPQPVLTSAVARPGHATSAGIGQAGPDVPGFAIGDNSTGYLSLTAASAPNLRTPPSNLLVDYWLYFANGGLANNYKFWRWHTFVNPGAINFYWSMPSGNTASESSTFTYFNAIGVQTIDGKWTHHRVYLHPSSTQREVYLQHAIDGRPYMNTGTAGNYVPPDPGFTAGLWPTLPAGDRLSTFFFEMQNDTEGNGARNAKQYIADVAIDEGYGAVYLGSAPTWTGSTHTEYQPYTAWAPGALTITVNRGTFGAGAAWLYVVNNGRLVNPTGYAVTLP